MRTRMSLGVLAAVLVAAPVSAQIVIRQPRQPDGRTWPSTPTTWPTTSSSRIDGGVARDIPPGHLPPRGMCRVWIDGVPPGRQPAPTDCWTAERTRPANARVIHGDQSSFPGKGKGKFKNVQSNRDGRNCSIWDGVVLDGRDGRVVNVCRDDDRVQSDRRGRRTAQVDRFDDDGRDHGNRGHGKGKGRGKKG